MLCLTRKVDESVVHKISLDAMREALAAGKEIVIETKVLSLHASKVRIGIASPKGLVVTHRAESKLEVK